MGTEVIVTGGTVLELLVDIMVEYQDQKEKLLPV
jgi:hypothetical protein